MEISRTEVLEKRTAALVNSIAKKWFLENPNNVDENKTSEKKDKVLCIEKIRKNRKMSLCELSSLTGISRATISKYERCLQEPKRSNLEKIAKAFNLMVPELYEDARERRESENGVYNHGFFYAQSCSLLVAVIENAIINDSISEIKDIIGHIGKTGDVNLGMTIDEIEACNNEAGEKVFSLYPAKRFATIKLINLDTRKEVANNAYYIYEKYENIFVREAKKIQKLVQE